MKPGEVSETKRCSGCHGDKPLAAFSRDVQKQDGPCSRCKECNRQDTQRYRDTRREEIRARERSRYAVDVEKQRERGRKYYARHPERALAQVHARRARLRSADGVHTAKHIQAQYERQNGRCFYCDCGLGAEYHRDHVIPLLLGGSNGPENLVVACPRCNRAKGAKHPVDFCGRLL